MPPSSLNPSEQFSWIMVTIWASSCCVICLILWLNLFFSLAGIYYGYSYDTGYYIGIFRGCCCFDFWPWAWDEDMGCIFCGVSALTINYLMELLSGCLVSSSLSFSWSFATFCQLMCKMAEFQYAYPALIVLFAIIPNKLDMIQHLLHSSVLSCFQSLLNLQQVHRMFNQNWIIIEP